MAKIISYIVIEINELRTDWARHNATFMQKVVAPSPEEATKRVRDMNEYIISLGDLIAIPESRFAIYNKHNDEVRKWED